MTRTLITCTAIAFAVIMIAYTARSPNSLIARVPFAVLVSVFPALLSAAVLATAFKLNALRRTWWNIGMVYIILFVLSLFAQNWLRTW